MSASLRSRVLLPPPEGAEITKRMPVRWDMRCVPPTENGCPANDTKNHQSKSRLFRLRPKMAPASARESARQRKAPHPQHPKNQEAHPEHTEHTRPSTRT